VHFDWITFLSVILDPVVMDCGQSLFIPPLFDGTNYVYWNVCMKAFLQVVEVGWKKPTEPLATWDDGKIKDANFKKYGFKCFV